MKESYLESEYYELWIEDEIIYGVYKPNLKVINIDIAKQMVKDRLSVSNGIPRPIFVDICKILSTDKLSRAYLAEGKAMKYLSAMAILVSNPVANLAAKVYTLIDNPSVPTRVFKDKIKALAWLEQYK